MQRTSTPSRAATSCARPWRLEGDDVTDVADLSESAEIPWPRLAPHVRAAGYGSVLSCQLVARGAAGALNLWGRAPGCYTVHDRLLGALFADQAAVALAGARRSGELHRSLASCDVIARAKGILMERFRIPDPDAFAMLVKSSQDTNIKLVDVATWLVDDAEATYARQNTADPARPAPPGAGDGRGDDSGHHGR